MKKEFVSYNKVLELKELGFDEPCLGYYAGDILCTGQPQEIHLDKDGNYKKTKTDSYPIIAAPTFSQAFRWFRDVHKLWAYQIPWSGNMYAMTIYRLIEDSETVKTIQDRVIMNTWEEAELECLKKLIEIVKEK